MTKLGRPESKNPRNNQIAVRFTEEELEKLDALSKHYNETRVEVIRRGINSLYSKIKK